LHLVSAFIPRRTAGAMPEKRRHCSRDDKHEGKHREHREDKHQDNREGKHRDNRENNAEIFPGHIVGIFHQFTL